MPRFYHPGPLSIGSQVQLNSRVAHHLHVVRLAQGEVITLFNGEGGEYCATLVDADRRHAAVEIKTFHPREAELPYAITLAQALPEGTKMDWIIEKAVELGVTAVQPLAAQRSVVRLSPERAAKRLEHWQGIIAAAAEQCGRNRLAQIAEPLDFQAWIGQHDLHRRILLTPRAEQSLCDWARHQPAQAVAIMIGPEGGFSEREEQLAIEHGALALSLGTRVLRTETAGMTAVAALNAVWGGF
ncbi:16S rRNA (uracil(1498)-N(3))-methyltransferase [Noviherbaspirillum galbum]|uniref:Ribosomal RNA small subunit methyltransferase E n=1 Tax=Noviherbaspirillum galbum TaxID=2709383 RepID=A0A6B3SMQ7_9BURK|nr:16S rRNA (uracil(1498)-N(3))-methyltransferase [Noviherbaspirillum galbum]NEX61997.1 16S rRNA (uracil(1498)-N(3))-methyltransferase [Noviherbaspirillum galbum]